MQGPILKRTARGHWISVRKIRCALSLPAVLPPNSCERSKTCDTQVAAAGLEIFPMAESRKL